MLQHLFDSPGEQADLLQRVEMLLMDVQLLPSVGTAAQEQAAAAAAVELEGELAAEGNATEGCPGMAFNNCSVRTAVNTSNTGADNDSSSGDNALDDACSISSTSSAKGSNKDNRDRRSSNVVSSSSSASGSNTAPPALGSVYNLLYQQHGLVGFMREHLPGGVVRLGFVRQPSRMAARAAVLDSSRDEQLVHLLQV